METPEQTTMRIDVLNYVLHETFAALNEECRKEISNELEQKIQNYMRLAMDSKMDIDMVRFKHQIYTDLKNKL